MKVLGLIIFILTGIISFLWSIAIVAQTMGFIGGFIAFSFFPATILFVPLYAALTQGNWILIALTYGGGIVGAFLMGMGEEK